MIFPELSITQEEKNLHTKIGFELVLKLKKLFNSRYGANPEVKCSGSTDKGTALPEKYFGIDFDLSVRADERLLERIAYRSNVFEGCQLFSTDFFQEFTNCFEDVYFAGHRLSGTFLGRNFDFSIADQKKDLWKWDYNASKYLKFSSEQLEEVKKIKFFMKKFNVYGSEVYGVVGPAVELMVFHHGFFDKILPAMKTFRRVPEDFRNAFSTMPFPEEFYALFPSQGDYIHEGLVKSFRYTTPNTFNRLVECTSHETTSLDDFLANHKPRFSHEWPLKTDNNRLVAYFLGTMLKKSNPFHVDIIYRETNLSVFASVKEKKELDAVCNVIQDIKCPSEIDFEALPKLVQEDITSKCDGENPAKYIFFIGQPIWPLQKGRIYIPFDFLVRTDAYKLMKIMEEGQIGAQ